MVKVVYCTREYYASRTTAEQALQQQQTNQQHSAASRKFLFEFLRHGHATVSPTFGRPLKNLNGTLLTYDEMMTLTQSSQLVILHASSLLLTQRMRTLLSNPNSNPALLALIHSLSLSSILHITYPPLHTIIGQPRPDILHVPLFH